MPWMRPPLSEPSLISPKGSLNLPNDSQCGDTEKLPCQLHKVAHEIKPVGPCLSASWHQHGCETYEKRLSHSAMSTCASAVASHLFLSSSKSCDALRSTIGSYCFTADVVNALFQTRRASVCQCLSRAPMRPPFALDALPTLPDAVLPSHTVYHESESKALKDNQLLTGSLWHAVCTQDAWHERGVNDGQLIGSCRR